MTKELLQQALDALTRLSFLGNGAFPGNSEGNRITQKAVSDIKQALAQQEPDDYAIAKRLAEAIYRKHYRAEAPNWEPLPDLAGVLSQIDNMTSGLVKAQQEQPASVDAYVGAREDAAIWKKRALEAEELNRKFIAELNGPTYFGEPVKQEQPAQETCWCDQNNIGEPGVSCGDCPTRDYKQPALSDLIELAKVYSQQYASPHHIVFSVDGLRHLIEAHLKGQK